MLGQYLCIPCRSPVLALASHTLSFCTWALSGSLCSHLLPLLDFLDIDVDHSGVRGSDTWRPTGCPGPFFSLGMHCTGFFQVDILRDHSLLSWSLGINRTIYLVPSLWDFVVTAAKAAHDLHMPDDFFLGCKCGVQHSACPCWFSDDLHQEVLISALQ